MNMQTLLREVTPIEAAALQEAVDKFIHQPYPELLRRALFQLDAARVLSGKYKRCVDALVDNFPDDPSAPSVALSRLENGKYYGSLIRFTEAFGKGKQVLFKCSHDTLEEVLSAFEVQLGLRVDPIKDALDRVHTDADGTDHQDGS